MLPIVVGALLAVGVALVSASSVASARFRRRFEEETAELERRARAAPLRVVEPPPDALPHPVRRYLEVTRASGLPVPRLARLRQRGRIRAAADRPWMRFDSEQVYFTDPPAFLWFARARVAPAVHVFVRDGFVDATGRMLVKALGLLTVANPRGPELDQGAGLRYWGEVLCFPEAVQDPHLRWEPLDERNARVRVRQDGLELEATVEFGPEGYPVATHARRYRDEGGGRASLTPWTGRSLDWKVIDGRLFPARWESIWHLGTGDLTAVEMEILGVAVE